VQTLEPDNDDDNEINDKEDVDDTEGSKCECSCKCTCKYWSRVKELFALEPREIEFFPIGFGLTTRAEIVQLPVPKHDANAHLYTAAFFCRTGQDWFIYRVIFALKRSVLSEEIPDIYKRLLSGAYFELSVGRRTKHPVTYLRNIVL
jgi:hypothetical protein